MTADTIARLKITLDDVEPLVLRRIEVPFDIRLDRLHEVLQAAMGWTNGHLYEICAPAAPAGGSPILIGPTDRSMHARQGSAKTLCYLYDFGDGWEHAVKIERLVDPVPGERYPRLLEANGRCPSEDVGGPHGYAEALEVIKDPRHERHAECKESMAENFDPAIVNVETIADELATLAKRWSRKPARRSKST
jgi:Plasmid pRiA4b ORF-3-like protein